MNFDEKSSTWLAVKARLEQVRNEYVEQLTIFGLCERDSDYYRGHINMIDITINDISFQLTIESD